MHYILLKGSDDKSRIAVNQELKRLRKRVKELEEQLEEVQGQYDYECECNKQFVACQKENEKLEQSQKQLAVEELEKVKADINTYNKEHCFLFPEIDTCNKSVEIIDNQIKVLKGEE